MGYWSEDEQFKNVLGVVQKGLADGTISLRFTPSGRTNFTVNETKLAHLLEGQPFDRESFDSVFKREITSMVQDEMQGRHRPSTVGVMLAAAEDEQVRRIYNERSQIVKRELITDDLTRRHHIKTTSKRSGFHALDWEIAEKLVLSSGSPLPHPYVTVNIGSIRPSQQLEEFLAMFPFFGDSEPGRIEYLAFDLDEEDVEALIKEFENIKKALHAAKERKSHG